MATGDVPTNLTIAVVMLAIPGDRRYPAIQKLINRHYTVDRDHLLDSIDFAVSENLGWHNSLTTLSLEDRYRTRNEAPRTQRIGWRFKGIQMPHPTNSIRLSRWGRLVELVFAGPQLPADFSQGQIIPAGFRPAPIAYEVLSAEEGNKPHQVVRVTVRGARIELSGNTDGQVLRGTVHWVTKDYTPK